MPRWAIRALRPPHFPSPNPDSASGYICGTKVLYAGEDFGPPVDLGDRAPAPPPVRPRRRAVPQNALAVPTRPPTPTATPSATPTPTPTPVPALVSYGATPPAPGDPMALSFGANAFPGLSEPLRPDTGWRVVDPVGAPRRRRLLQGPYAQFVPSARDCAAATQRTRTSGTLGAAVVCPQGPGMHQKGVDLRGGPRSG